MIPTSEFVKNERLINLSEQLRKELMIKIEELSENNILEKQVNDTNRCLCFGVKEDILILYLTAFKDYDNESANKIVRAIRIWCNMYYDDRISVLEKFKDCCRNDSLLDVVSKTNLCIVFCRLFITDLSKLLNNAKWSDILKLD